MNKMRRAFRPLALLLALCLVLAWFPVRALAEEMESTDETVPEGAATATEPEEITSTSGTCGENLTWTLDGAGTLTISGTGRIESSPWDKVGVKKVVINEGVTNIYGLNGCSNLTSVTIPDSVINIYENAFYGCSSLESVELPAHLETIAGVAFGNCSSLKEIVIPASVTWLGSCMFLGCVELNKIVFLGDMPSIGMKQLGPLFGITATVYYPGSNDTYTEEMRKIYYDSQGFDLIPAGTITWVACYNIVEGENSQWPAENDGDLTFRADGPISKFVSASVDGGQVDPANYTVTEGSTIVTLHEDYLKTLNVGEHTLTVTFTDGEADTVFTILDVSQTPTEPTEPSEPTAPTESTDPSEPTEIVEPTDPEVPAGPGESTKPEEQPAEPGEPTAPMESTEPSDPTDSEEPTAPEAPASTDNPKTGDNTLTVCLVMLLISGMGLMAAIVYNRKFI